MPSRTSIGDTDDTDGQTDEWRLRVDLAAVFRLAAEFQWHESVGNHFSAAVSPDGRRFLLNPRWRHFKTIRASDLLLLDADDPVPMERPGAPDPSAWTIHGAIHRLSPRARVILHCHPPYATALACLRDPTIKPIDQNTARFYDLVGVDLEFRGIADDRDEGLRLAACFGDRPILMMGNHGVTVTAPTVAQAFEHLYFLERASQTLMLAYASGQPLSILSHEVAQRTAEDWRAYDGMAFAHFDQLKMMLNQRDPSYLT